MGPSIPQRTPLDKTKFEKKLIITVCNSLLKKWLTRIRGSKCRKFTTTRGAKVVITNGNGGQELENNLLSRK